VWYTLLDIMVTTTGRTDRLIEQPGDIENYIPGARAVQVFLFR
jgi:hypothetical protein